MNVLRKLRERTVAESKRTEQLTAARKVPVAKMSKNMDRLRNMLRPRSVLKKNVAASSGKLRAWIGASPMTYNITDEPVSKQNNVLGRIKSALRPRPTKKSVPALTDNSSDVLATGTTSTGGEAGQPEAISLSNRALKPEPASSHSSSSDDYSAPRSSNFSLESDAETSLTVRSHGLSDNGRDKPSDGTSVATGNTTGELEARHVFDAAAHDIHGLSWNQDTAPDAMSHAPALVKNSPVSQEPRMTLETAMGRLSWSKYPSAGYVDTPQGDDILPKTPANVSYNTATASRSENLLRDFGYVCEIPHEAIIRLVHEKFPNRYTTAGVLEMKHGTFNCVYFINVDEKEKILLRVPAVARKHLWRDEDEKMMINDFRTTKFIGQKVDFGLPKMLNYDVGFENAIQAPHIFESYIPGKPLYQVQREWKAQGTYQTKNARAMKQLGAGMAQLCQKDLQFDRIGMLEFDNDDCSNPRVGPTTYMESSLDFGDSMRLKRVGPERDVHERLYTLSTSQSFFSDPFYNLHWDVNATGLKRSYQRIIALGLELVPGSKLYPREEKERFGLRHPDLDFQNILFDDEGNLQGVIDWSGTLTAPNYLSCASQPKFLVKDFMAWIPLAATGSSGFENEQLAKQRSQFGASFTDSLVGKLGAGYLKKSPWLAAFERGVNDFEWMEGAPVGRKNFVDKLFAANPHINKDCFLEYLANGDDDGPSYSEYYQDSTGIKWPHGDFDVLDHVKEMISWAFHCDEPVVRGYYGIGRNGPLTSDMDGNADMYETTKEQALTLIEDMERNKDDQIKAFGGEEMYQKLKNEFCHRVGRLEYLEQLAQSRKDLSDKNDHGDRAASTALVGHGGHAAEIADAAVQQLEPLAGYSGRASEQAQNEPETRELVIGFQGRKTVVHQHKPQHKEPTPEEKATFGSITSIDHNNISDLVKRLIEKSMPDGVRVMNHTASGSYNFVYFIKVFGGQIDGVEMALRIPARGREGLWTKSDQNELMSQARAMVHIKENTMVPTPTVFFHDDTLENEIRAPFILMECVSGKSLGDCMVSWDIQGILGKMLSKALSSIARAMVELGKLQFNQIGELQFVRGQSRTPPSVYQDWTPDSIDSTEQYFRVLFEKVRKSEWPLEYKRICEANLEAIPKSKMSQDQQVETFGLIHRDMDAQNFLVDTDGNLVAILDWDWLQTGPNSIGPHAFPKFLQDDPSGQYNHLFVEGQMAKLRTVYNKLYEEEYIAAHGDAFGGMANKTSLLICDMERGLRNGIDGPEKFMANLFEHVLPEFDAVDILSILAAPERDCTDIKKEIIERFRLFLSGDLRKNGNLETTVGSMQHLADFQGQRLQSLAANDEVLVRNDGVSSLPSLVYSREPSPTSSDESDQLRPTSAQNSGFVRKIEYAPSVADNNDDSDTESEDDDDRFANILGFQRKN